MATEFPVSNAASFAKSLSKEPQWYTVGTFLEVPTAELDIIDSNYSKAGIMRCYIEVYKCLETRGEPLTWDHVATSLRQMGNHGLAEVIHPDYILSPLHTPSDRVSPSTSGNESLAEPTEIVSKNYVKIKDSKIDKIANEFESLSERFILLLTKIETAFKNSNVDIAELQGMIEGKCGLSRLSQPTFDAVFGRLNQRFSILNVRALVFLVNNLLKKDKVLRNN